MTDWGYKVQKVRYLTRFPGPIEHSQLVVFEEVRAMLDLLLILLPYLLSMTLISPVKTTALADVQDGDHLPSHPQDGEHLLVKLEKVAGVEDGDHLLSQVEIIDPATRTLQRGQRSPVVVAGASFISISRKKQKKQKKIKKRPKKANQAKKRPKRETALFLPTSIFYTNRRNEREFDSKLQENVAENLHREKRFLKKKHLLKFAQGNFKTMEECQKFACAGCLCINRRELM